MRHLKCDCLLCNVQGHNLFVSIVETIFNKVVVERTVKEIHLIELANSSREVIILNDL